MALVYDSKISKFFSFLLDTGADVSCFHICHIVLNKWQDHQAKVSTLKTLLKCDSKNVYAELFVIEGLSKPILAIEAILNLNLSLGNDVCISNINKIGTAYTLDKFPNIFNDIGNFKNKLEIKVCKDVEPFVKTVPRTVSISLLKIVKAEKDR